jgi:hypothetical protein
MSELLLAIIVESGISVRARGQKMILTLQSHQPWLNHNF